MPVGRTASEDATRMILNQTFNATWIGFPGSLLSEIEQYDDPDLAAAAAAAAAAVSEFDRSLQLWEVVIND